MPVEFLISALVTLVVVVDPIGLVPAFMAITHGLPKPARRAVALRACLIAAAILAGSALIGDWLLRTLSITLPAFALPAGCCCSRLRRKWCSACASSGNRSRPRRHRRSVRNVAAFRSPFR